ncbi:TlyA family RNA methyltransferase [Phocicoccus pinnipedialis]|uniref:Hemolysin A n=1 Tax=Phocicoccus pinnipedialis TaxID=110845 RepID=A0A6V7RE96_9BACL|nr:TlyA family RNA methyltransferase [Jeotgalicoccus pinnipedialis]MBP1939325.1 23S rRNA (cytidine1920-2'-O)/16S rRNA (cytidine1409-2'-O)-methyltransferase [Jeotgalicoccus pinnipedialis]CAD2075867.1 Hemolysin A [Jeotgalicoccus pinnipedialis]
MKKNKTRADLYLYEHFNLGTIEDIRRLIMAGKVLNNNTPVYKPSDIIVEETANIRFKNIKEFVSRGGLKLREAILVFNLDINDKVIVDIGSSTGGFTDCALAHGARLVYAVDVGTNQLDYSLRVDERVIVLEQTNFKDITDEIRELPNTITIDVSFTSIIPILRHIKALWNHNYEVIALIKPQFESYLEEREQDGIIRSKETQKLTIERVVDECAFIGFSTYQIIESPIKGTKGNTEFLLHIINDDNNNKLTNEEITAIF